MANQDETLEHDLCMEPSRRTQREQTRVFHGDTLHVPTAPETKRLVKHERRRLWPESHIYMWVISRDPPSRRLWMQYASHKCFATASEILLGINLAQGAVNK